MSLINHGCVPNVIESKAKGDYKRKQVRAVMVIEKGEEILSCYLEEPEFLYGSREFRQQELLERSAFLCQCSQCSLEGAALQDDERMRAGIRETDREIKVVG